MSPPRKLLVGTAAHASLTRAGIVLGLGIGAFFDGIVFHQLLQWHHMLTSHPDPAIAGNLPLNTFWDGLFHVSAYLFTIAGVVLIWRVRRRTEPSLSGWVLIGATVMGWGLFNLVEGSINHFLLGIHHVWADGPGSVLLWDLTFLVWGAMFLGLGYAQVRGAARERREPSTRP